MSATQTTLRLLDPRLSTLITHEQSPERLRRFAFECARFAVTATALHDGVLETALDLARKFTTSPWNQAEAERQRGIVESYVEQLDTAAFDAQDAHDAGKGSQQAYDTAFARARAATSVLRCLEPDALQAAAEACYEAFHATENLAELVKIATASLSA